MAGRDFDTITVGQTLTGYTPVQHIDSFPLLMYMAYPRLCALSEVVWTPLEDRDYSDFKACAKSAAGCVLSICFLCHGLCPSQIIG